MSKKIKILLKGTIEVPDNADILHFQDEDNIETDHLRLGGRLFRPYISWMEYFSTAIMQKRYPNGAGGQSWQTVRDDISNEYLLSIDEEWYLQDIPEDDSDSHELE